MAFGMTKSEYAHSMISFLISFFLSFVLSCYPRQSMQPSNSCVSLAILKLFLQRTQQCVVTLCEMQSRMQPSHPIKMRISSTAAYAGTAMFVSVLLYFTALHARSDHAASHKRPH